VSEADYIIVGGGSAGCVLAARLAEDPGARVLLLEAGPSERGRLKMRIPLAWRDTFRDPAVSWGFQTEPEAYADGRVVPAPRGRVLGGCASVNGMMYSRGCRADYDAWARAGISGWGYDDVLPYYRRSEANWRGDSQWHGAEGPLTVARHQPDEFIYSRLIETAGRLGYRHLDDFHGADFEGFSAPDFNVHRGERASTVTRFLRPAMRRANLQVVTDALARRVLFDGRRATGVEYEIDGQPRTAHAARAVVLAAGAFNSPQLLLLSGIGPATELQRHGIAVLQDLPGVGRNLQEHQSLAMIYEASGPFTFDRELRLDRMALAALRWQLFGTGPMAGLPVSAQGFVRTDPALASPDLQLLVSPVSMLAQPWFPLWRRGAGHVFSVACVLVRPESRGEVTLRSADPRAQPVIRLNLLQAEADRAAFRRIVRFVRRFFATEPAASLVRAERSPGPAVQADADIDAHLRRSVATAMHPTSTCAMGVDAQAVLDPALRVRGVDALYVADASSLPTIVSGNTNAPAIMVAEKAADLIRAARTARRADTP
jgi:choline dehydrogenase